MYNIFVGNVLHFPTSKLYTFIRARKFSLKTDPLFWILMTKSFGQIREPCRASIHPVSNDVMVHLGNPVCLNRPSAHVHTDVLFETHFRDKIYFWILRFSCHVIGWRLEIVCLINNNLFNLITTILIPVYWQLYIIFCFWFKII